MQQRLEPNGSQRRHPHQKLPLRLRQRRKLQQGHGERQQAARRSQWQQRLEQSHLHLSKKHHSSQDRQADRQPSQREGYGHPEPVSKHRGLAYKNQARL